MDLDEQQQLVRCLADGAARSIGVLQEQLTWRAVDRRHIGAGVLRGVLAEEPMAHLLPDGRWLWLPATLDGRVVTVSARPAGVLTGDDIALPASRFDGWERVPVTHRHGMWRHRGLAELTWGPRGHALVLPAELLPHPSWQTWALRIGVEGLDLVPAAQDRIATRRLRAAARHMWRRVEAGWSPLDVQLAMLAEDTGLLRGPTVPLGGLWTTGRAPGRTA